MNPNDMRVILVWFFIVNATVYARCTSPDEDIKKCSAGSMLDTACVQKHLPRFEKYVISDNDQYLAKWDVSTVLVRYYDQAGSPATDSSSKVRSKNKAFAEARAIEQRIVNTHHHTCQTGPGCETGGYFDVSMKDLDREEDLAVKQYFVGIDPGLFKGEIKFLDSLIRIDSRN